MPKLHWRTRRRLAAGMRRLAAFSSLVLFVAFCIWANAATSSYAAAHPSRLPMAADVPERATVALGAVMAAQSPAALVALPPTVPPSTLSVLRGVCASFSHDTIDCTSDLYAMALIESGLNPDSVSDQGRSHGYYSIQVKLHNVSLSCTRSLPCASAWTLAHLGGHGYWDGRRTYAIQRFNGSGHAAMLYAEKVKRKAKAVRTEVEKLFTI